MVKATNNDSADIIAKVAEEIKVSRTVAGKALALIIGSIVEPNNRGKDGNGHQRDNGRKSF
jgi:hypothetical protein